MFASLGGAIDLASIMVGVIVIGVVAGVIAATVFAVIPWAQDGAAKATLDSVRTAESVYRVMPAGEISGGVGGGLALVTGQSFQSVTATERGYGELPDLADAGLFNYIGNQLDIDANAGGYVAAIRSDSGQMFYLTSGSNTATAVAPTGNALPEGLTVPIISTGAAGPKIETNALADAQVGHEYAGAVRATSELDVTYALLDGSLPAGLDLDTTDGTITGIPTAEGEKTFTISATNSRGTDGKTYDLTVLPAAPAISTTSLPSATIGKEYDAQVVVPAGTTITSFTVNDGELPDGLDLDNETGAITGTPTTLGTETFTVKAANTGGAGYADLSIAVVHVAPTITTSTLPNAQVGASYNEAISVSDSAGVTWKLTGGALPAGLNFVGQDVKGTPTSSGSATFTMEATNSGGSVSKVFTITTLPAAPVFTAPSDLGHPYGDIKFSVADSTGVTWKLTGGALPNGLNVKLDETTGILSSGYMWDGTYTLTIEATNSGGSTSKTFTFTIDPT